jgi:hypothetical protein
MHTHCLASMQGWGLHVWGGAVVHTDWQQPLPASGYDSVRGSAYWDVQIKAVDCNVGLLIHKGEMKAAREC